MTEILSPAGGAEHARAAVMAGADAVYLGLKRFSARAGAMNFSEEELRETVGFCHERGVKVYAAVNTMIFDNELDELADTLRLLCETGVDALIVQDLAVVAMAEKCCPDLPLHASTQMTLHTRRGEEFAARLGMTRTVLSRELDLKTIAELSGGDMETEVFVHGAMCMSVSGQCLMSAVVGGRSANRGACAQPCRLPCSVKKGGDTYALSLKDMSVLPRLRELEAAGVSSMKIEGRMKRPEYCALSAHCAKATLNGKKYDGKLLERVFSRGGFTDGYLDGERGIGMFGRRTADDAKEAAAAYPKIHELYRREYKRSKLDFFVTIKAGEPVKISATDENYLFAEYTGTVPAEAVNKPVTAQSVEERLSKLGDTFYEAGSFTCDIGAELSVPASELNEARRTICESITAQRREHFSRVVNFTPCGQKPVSARNNKPERTEVPPLRLELTSAEQLLKLDPADIETAFLPLDLKELHKVPKNFPIEKLGIAMPRFTFDEPKQIQMLKEAAALGIKDILCTNFAHIIIAGELGLTAHAAHGLNTANGLALEKLKS
ncbi:MAG: U32 family peptidase, partial [Ruminococcus sp.]|nr:U32 family peptidase [Ruminococcus sp.]